MKTYVALAQVLIAIGMILGMAGCGGSSSATTAAATPSSPTSTTPPVTQSSIQLPSQVQVVSAK